MSKNKLQGKAIGNAEERARELLKKMTLPEKIGQLSGSIYGFSCYERSGSEISIGKDVKDDVEKFGGIGEIYGLFRADPWSDRSYESGLVGKLAPKMRNMIQRYVIENSRLGIPVLFSNECPHGNMTLDGYMLPVNLASASTFSPDLVYEAFSVCGRQMKEMGVDIALVSVMDVLRDPRWGRSEETFGEDPFLVSKMCTSVVTALRKEGVAVCAKHFAAHGQTTGGINSSPAGIGERELREIHLPPARAAVTAGAETVMSTYNEIDGIYCCANKHLLRDILRDELGFNGVVIADALAIESLNSMTGDAASSAALALSSGVDMGLLDRTVERLDTALSRGEVTMEEIDGAVLRVLTLKFKRGLFENPYVSENDGWTLYTKESHPIVKRLTEESMVLLKNGDSLLPLDKNKPMRIGITGPSSDHIYRQMGDYTPPLKEGGYSTFLCGLRDYTEGTGISVKYVPFALDASEDDVTSVAKALSDVDLIIAAVGGSSDRYANSKTNANGQVSSHGEMDCGEGVDSSTLRLPGRQTELLSELKRNGKKLITLLSAGRPYEMKVIDEASDAIVCAFYSGTCGGEAFAKILFGDVSPAGRLPVSLPDRACQIPVYYNPKRSYRVMHYSESHDAPRYSFGHGLTYTDFKYRLCDAPTKDAPLVTFEVQNVGDRPAYAVPQLYLSRLTGIVTARTRELCAFDKVYLQPGESRTVRLTIPESALSQIDHGMKNIMVHGSFEWFIRDTGSDHLCGKTEL